MLRTFTILVEFGIIVHNPWWLACLSRQIKTPEFHLVQW